MAHLIGLTLHKAGMVIVDGRGDHADGEAFFCFDWHGHKFRLAITDPEASPSTSATAPAPADQVIAAIRELIESAAIETKRKHASERTDGDLDAGRNSAIAALAELRAIR